MRMSTAHLPILSAISAILLLATGETASADMLKPFKDELFSNQTVIESHDNGAFQTIDYQEMRDINGRDQIPEKRVKPAYVDTGVRWKAQEDETLEIGGRKVDVTRIGPASKQAFTVIFIHGRGGDRRLGSNDYTFGGNFNRLKNLAYRNGGTYYAPSVRGFDSNGVADIAALIRYSYEQSGGKPVILSCASMGSFICWGITRDAESVKRLKGMAILSGVTDPDFTKSAFYKAKLPLWFTHGSKDPVYAAADQQVLFEKLFKAHYPTRFTLFETGNHGTPVRMTDWRKVLNWIVDPQAS
ncbi:alpha/beta fold hydrolase [Rhizobium sp. CNPSo 4039]|uniref:alpha/beta hydrolase n=1 Tax=Rhizobium sp. CNPSo 4039 TaxID=3021409 RepID=UPI00254C6E61|nr:alpha/beta fold hydrolase [Rhizobium sp. CNPSo 4039]MDK4714119.1 alpha/beta hydrolase [Rhizobium sp. CNPSo 4039]